MPHVLLTNLTGLIAEISLGAAILVVRSAFSGWSAQQQPWLRHSITGLTFGLAGALAVLFPVTAVPGAPVSTVTACVGLAGLFGGWTGGGVAIVMATAARYLADHPHLAAGAVRAVMAAGVGIGIASWAHHHRSPLRGFHLVAQGMLIVPISVVASLASHVDQATIVAESIPLAIVLPLSTVLLGMQYLTEQRREELSRRVLESETRLRDIIEHLPGSIFQMRRRPDGSPEYLFYRDSAVKSDVESRQVEQQPSQVTERLLPEEDEHRERFFRETLASGKAGSVEYRMRQPDGSLAWVRTRATPRMGSDRRPLWTGITSDITEEKRRDDELRRFTAALGESERRFRAVMDSLPGMVFEARENPDGTLRYTYISEGSRMLGLAPQELIADPTLISRLYLPEDEPERLRVHQEAREALKLREREFRVRLADGTVRWLHSRALPHETRGGDILWDGIVIDTTDMKQLQDVLHRSDRAFALGALTEGVAHAFNERLVAIGKRIQALLAGPALAPIVRDELTAVQRLSDQGGKLEEDLERFLRVPASDGHPVDAKMLLQDVVELARSFVGSGTRLSIRVNPGLWPVSVDAGLLQNAILTLILEARNALPGGGEVSLIARNGMLTESEAQAMRCEPGPYVRIRIMKDLDPHRENGPKGAPGAAGTLRPADRDPGIGAVRILAARSHGYLHVEDIPGPRRTIELLLPAQAIGEQVGGPGPFPAP